MKLAIFGGSGRTGQYLVKQALEQGYQVAALARNPTKIGLQNPNLAIIRGDVKDSACVAQVMSGADAVISVLGPTHNEPTFEISQGTAHILAAMKRAGVRRLIITAGAGVSDPNDAPKLLNHMMNFLIKRMAANVLADMTRVVDLVRASDLEWTVVRLPMLTDDPKRGKVRIGFVGKGMGARITRSDTADFLLKQVDDKTYVRKSPAISN